MSLPVPAPPRTDAEVIAWVAALLRVACDAGASDLHVDPQAQGALLRLRIHGVLEDWCAVPPLWAPRLVARIKVMAHMDLAERRLPQDGRLLDSGAGLADIRVASLPTLHGEKLCLRLGDGGAPPPLSALGLADDCEQSLRTALRQPDGLILITGPTGAGKTATLYACLQQLNLRSRHIATVEDPVERVLAGINQTPVQPRLGLDFASVLRALLRQDPDVLMVGEIRDRETAAMAVQAAETGHLVLSTLHTGSALDALSRLRHLGIADYLLADTLRLVLAQRLLRRVCGACRGCGCGLCQQGHVGRIAIFEHVEMTPVLAQAWRQGADSDALRRLVHEAGWPDLQARAQTLLDAGATTADDILRVLGLELAPAPC